MKYELDCGIIIHIDKEDFERVNKYKWYFAESSGYIITNVKRNGKWFTLSIHRFLMNEPKGKIIDHHDGNKLNNTKENLRICTKQQNAMNAKKQKSASNFKGVSISQGKFKVSIHHNHKFIHIGTFSDELTAALAYNRKAKELFGDFAWLNPVEDDGREIKFSEQIKKTSNYKGVYRKGEKFVAQIKHQKKQIYIGSFEFEQEAALAYNQKAIELLGYKAKINKI